MRSNRGKDTVPEKQLRQALWAAGLRGYRKNVRSLPGKPDLVFRRAKVAIFLHGCFWHLCPTCKKPLPKANHDYWLEKLSRNALRDAENAETLQALGYRVVTIWECELRQNPEAAVGRVREGLRPGE